MNNNSPWITELKRTRPLDSIAAHTKVDIAIVGGGIAGISTAYFILKYTKHKVLLLEAAKIAHGATGHNAGQLVSYFERQISQIAEEFGENKTIEAQEHIMSAWRLIEDIMAEAKLETPLYQFTGYAGMTDFDEIMLHLKNNRLTASAHIQGEPLLVAEETDIAKRIPKEYEGLYSLVPQKDILSLLETEDIAYVAALSARKGCMNSALFTEELAGYLLSQYSERFRICENSPMSEVVLTASGAHIKVNDNEVNARRVVLCTNGFEKFTITNRVGVDIDTNFHATVQGAVGYMAAYLEDRDKSPVAVSYLGDKDVYFYLTRRPFENEKNEKHNLVCIGGPETIIEDTSSYHKDVYHYPEEATKEIDHFIHTTYANAPEGKIDYKYQWHGLMGYTPNKVRLIGEEPRNRTLLYNLGCNGIGILPSVYGAKRISQILNDEKLESSIFDPK